LFVVDQLFLFYIDDERSTAHAIIIFFTIIVILPPYMEIYKVFNLYLGINFANFKVG